MSIAQLQSARTTQTSADEGRLKTSVSKPSLKSKKRKSLMNAVKACC